MTDARANEVPEAQLTALNDALEAAGIYVAVELRDDALILSGEVDSSEMRQAAFDLAGVVAGRYRLRLEDAIDVLEIEPELRSDERDDVGPATPSPDDPNTIYDVGTVDPGLAAEEAIPYFPPTDPVIGEQLIEQDDVEVIGGFQPTAMDDDVDRRYSGDDERITDDVLAELREDATTTDLSLRVETRNGIVFLRGEVSSPEDADNAEAVAGRVAGVIEVRDDLIVVGPVANRHESERVSSP
jgi:osmotically-inducible protein OsmY